MTDSTVLRLDGGLSTALEANGHSVGGSMWTGELLLSNPGAVTEAHRQFVDAGADIIITGSYQLSFEGGRRADWSDEDTERALRNSTTAARLAADEGTLVAASIGPYGAFLNDGSEFHGNYGVSDSVIREFHDRRLDVLLATEPDLLAMETMPDLAEVQVILELIGSKNADIPFWVAFTVSMPGIIAGGGTFADACALVSENSGAIAVGINCSPVSVITPTLSGVETDLPFVVYPNAGQAWDSDSMSWMGQPAALTTDHVAEWAALGARIVGGCCGHGPATMKETFEKSG
ncbi:MAG: homocysteine S-methyltransferase [Microbacteriaceae bacterium]|nr:homocysteine S-methyltransferase [Microbacteriaceae bacterium]